MMKKTHYDLLKGKLSKKTLERVDISGQKGCTCALNTMRRLANFQNGDILKNSNEYKAYKIIKNALEKLEHDTKNNWKDLSLALNDACDLLGIDVKNTIKRALHNKAPNCNAFMIEHLANATIENDNFQQQKISILYGALQERIFEAFGLQASSYRPEKENIEEFKKMLLESGPMMLVGKFGRVFHTSWGRKPTADTEECEMYAFPKGSYIGNAKDSFWTHAIIVDDVRQIDGVDMVVFIDPFDDSKVNEKQKRYLMRYETFCERLGEFNKTNAIESIVSYNVKK
jgi:hypothetical protein